MEKILEGLFHISLKEFIESDSKNIQDDVSERNWCARLGIFLQKNAESFGLKGYYADAEYNRNENRTVKTIYNKEIQGSVQVTCDLILHSRGNKNPEGDNLIAIEMKKSDVDKKKIESDRIRLAALTEQFNEAVFHVEGEFPKNVCGYKLGYLIIIDNKKMTMAIETYRQGKRIRDCRYDL